VTQGRSICRVPIHSLILLPPAPSGPPDTLIQPFIGTLPSILRSAHPLPSGEDAEKPFPIIQGAELQRSEGRKKWFAFDRSKTPASALIAAVSARCAVSDLTVTDVEIEAVIRAMYADQAGH
jgi:hypothetical protein